VLAEFTHWVQTSLQAGPAKTSSSTTTPPTPPATPPTASVPPRPMQTPPPAPAPTQSQPTIGQVLKFEQSSRDDR
jgi:hypothetical protein